MNKIRVRNAWKECELLESDVSAADNPIKYHLIRVTVEIRDRFSEEDGLAHSKDHYATIKGRYTIDRPAHVKETAFEVWDRFLGVAGISTSYHSDYG